jgi:hypothetical protein
MTNRDLFDRLIRAEDESGVEKILDEAGFSLANEAAWRPLGDMENNFSTVGNQQTEPTAALVEKIINGIDAVLLAECYSRKIDPEGSGAPATMAEAVQKFFGVRDGRLENLSATEQTGLADNIHTVAVGDKTSPCYLIIDRGEGQTPASFPDTFCSLNRSNKLRIPFVQGKFNAGGTGVLQFCGEKNIQLIVSRRHPEAPVRADDKTKNLWGFTVIRRMKPTAGRRSSMYVYLAPGGDVPSFEADAIKVLPQKRRAIHPEHYAEALRYGTCVKLYNFRWKARSIATTEARYELERYLHSPCLPFRLTETRDYNANYFATTISGVWVSVAGQDGEPESAKIEPGFPAYATLALKGVGELPYRLVVFREEVKARHIPHGVFFTVNGQVHGSLPADFVTRRLRFDYLADHLLVSVDCTGMDSTVREDFFMASRDRVRRNEVYESIVDHLEEALREHQGLRDLNAARRKKEIERHITNKDETSAFFNDLLKSDPALAALFNLGGQLVTSTGPGTPTPFVGRKFPTYFRVARAPREGIVKHCPLNRTTRVEFETDAVNDYFRRSDSPGNITTDPPGLIESSQLWNGSFTARFCAPWSAKPGDSIRVTVTVADVEADKRGGFVSTFTIVAEDENERPLPPPGKNRHRNGRAPRGNGRRTTPSLAEPNIIEVRQDEWEKRTPPFNPYTALEVRHNDQGGYDFFLNVDNTFLLTEMTRAKKEEDKALIKFWFRYGVALCAMGMLQEQKRRAEDVRDNDGANGDAPETTENLADVGLYCSGIARVIIPIIRALYRGPGAEG